MGLPYVSYSRTVRLANVVRRPSISHSFGLDARHDSKPNRTKPTSRPLCPPGDLCGRSVRFGHVTGSCDDVCRLSKFAYRRYPD